MRVTVPVVSARSMGRSPRPNERRRRAIVARRIGRADQVVSIGHARLIVPRPAVADAGRGIADRTRLRAGVRLARPATRAVGRCRLRPAACAGVRAAGATVRQQVAVQVHLGAQGQRDVGRRRGRTSPCPRRPRRSRCRGRCWSACSPGSAAGSARRRRIRPPSSAGSARPRPPSCARASGARRRSLSRGRAAGSRSPGSAPGAASTLRRRRSRGRRTTSSVFTVPPSTAPHAPSTTPTVNESREGVGVPQAQPPHSAGTGARSPARAAGPILDRRAAERRAVALRVGADRRG